MAHIRQADKLQIKTELVLRFLSTAHVKKGGRKVKIRTKTMFTHIRISDNSKKHLSQLKVIGQSYDGFTQEPHSTQGGEMEITQQDWDAYEEIRKNPIAKLTGQVRFGRVLGLPKEKLEWIRNHYWEASKKFNTEITQQDWIAYEEVMTNPITRLTGPVLFGRVLGLPKKKLEWIRNHYCELSKRFNMGT